MPVTTDMLNAEIEAYSRAWHDLVRRPRPKFVPGPGVCRGFVRNPPEEGVLDRIMREHFAGQVSR